LYRILNNVIYNFKGYRLSDKIVVIESDDWGSIRVASNDSFKKLLNKGFSVDKSPYDLFDGLESNTDLEFLFDVLCNIRGGDNKPPIITANNIVANPDFQRIKESDFNNYFHEPFTETLKSYPNRDKVIKLYNQGINDGLVMPQFHGREHVNIKRWLNILKDNSNDDKNYFENSIFSINKNDSIINQYLAAFDFDNNDFLVDQNKIIVDGLNLFENIWGFKSKSFIAPCYTWHPSIEKILFENEVISIQGLPNQFSPDLNNIGSYKKIYHYQGQKNIYNQRYFVRNAFFEPTINSSFDWESDCMRRMQFCFLMNKPVIISTHRLNFIGIHDSKNRDNNLRRFKNLLNRIIKKWPDVQFKSSVELTDLYNS
jgi:hypothetical protein